ncbi:MAG: hypothetical protein ACJ8FY_09720 [Gemmataceae bacterium]
MIDETPLVAPLPVEHLVVEQTLENPGHPLPPADPDKVRALDAVFAQQRESEQVANLLGMWTGGILLADLAKEHFMDDATETPEEKKKPFLPKDPQE